MIAADTVLARIQRLALPIVIATSALLGPIVANFIAEAGQQLQRAATCVAQHTTTKEPA